MAEHIFSFVDISSLKSCRGVSQKWNELASRVLGPKTTVEFQFRPHKCKESKCPPKKLKGIKESETQQSLFVNYKMDNYRWKETTQQNPTCLSAFNDFFKSCGSNFKSLSVTTTRTEGFGRFHFVNRNPDYPILINEDLHRIYKIVTKTCPNLNTLEVLLPDELREVKHAQIIDDLQFPKSLLITTLKMKGAFKSNTVSNFYIRLIKSCSKLANLELKCFSPIQSEYYNHEESPRTNGFKGFCGFLQDLSELPEVTKNLKEFLWGDAKDPLQGEDGPRPWGGNAPPRPPPTDREILKFVSKIKFSKKLKTLTIGSSVDECDENKRFLPIFINNVGEFVEKLNFTGKYTIKKATEESDTSGRAQTNYVSEQPQMPSVKFLWHQEESHYDDVISVEFIAKAFPNLVKFIYKELDFSTKIKQWHWDWWFTSRRLNNGEIDYYSSQNLFFSTSKKYMDDGRNESLKSLSILKPLSRENSFYSCVELYPNLTNLVILAHYDLEKKIPIRRNKFGKNTTPKVYHSFCKLPKLKSLKEFTYLWANVTDFGIQQLFEALKNIKNCEELEGLNIVSTEGGHELSFESIKKGLNELAGLKCTLRLARFKMPEVEVTQMMDYAKDNGIRLEWFGGENGKAAFQLPPDSAYSNHKNSIIRIQKIDQKQGINRSDSENDDSDSDDTENDDSDDSENDGSDDSIFSNPN